MSAKRHAAAVPKDGSQVKQKYYFLELVSFKLFEKCTHEGCEYLGSLLKRLDKQITAVLRCILGSQTAEGGMPVCLVCSIEAIILSRHYTNATDQYFLFHTPRFIYYF